MTIAYPTLDPQTVAGVLSEIAETASETLELQDVFGRIAASVRRVIPLDHMGVVRILDGGDAVKHASTFGLWAAWRVGSAAEDLSHGGENCPAMRPCSLAAWSPRIRPRPGDIRRVDDTLLELDPSFEGDARILASGARSTLWAPFRAGGPFTGGVWLSAFRPHAFTEEHQHTLRPIAALLGTAVEHWKIWDGERRRRQRLDQLEAVMGTIAESLDVRDVFSRISAG